MMGGEMKKYLMHMFAAAAFCIRCGRLPLLMKSRWMKRGR